MSGTEQESILKWIESHGEAMRLLTEIACNINSFTDNVPGINKVRSLFREHFLEIADHVYEIPLPTRDVVDSAGQIYQFPVADALQAIKRPEAPCRIFLCIHLDTVYPPDSPFQECTETEPGVLNGPGVIDAKGGAVVLLFALKALEQFSNKHEIGWEVVLNTDEEIGSPSSQDFVKTRAQTCDLGLLFEPAMLDGTLVDRRKGSGNFSIIIRGRAAHSGRDFDHGRNAIARGAEMATMLHSLNAQYEETTINVARIDGGGPLNVVPDLAVIRVNVRVADETQQNWFHTQLQTLVDDCDQEDGFSCELHGGFFSPPKNLDPGSILLKGNIEECARDLGIDIAWRASGGVSDGNKLASVKVPNIDTLGVRGNNMHSTNEFLVIDSLVERVKLTTLILMRYATGEFKPFAKEQDA